MKEDYMDINVLRLDHRIGTELEEIPVSQLMFA